MKGIKKEFPSSIISVDTTKYEVAVEALKSGAEIINDISGLTFDERIADAVAEYNAGLILMHIKGTPKNMQVNPEYKDIISEIKSFFYTQINKAEIKGVDKIIIDPGIGFGKKYNDNFLILNRLKEFCEIKYPLMIGVSRKSFIGNELTLDVTERDIPSAILETASIQSGARIIRTHNYKNGIYIRRLMRKIIMQNNV
ncbi:MAG: dihydropteroate synthase [Ignavibacteriales bacterium]|nr:dihydropteroate synthase [Ignavibacteriales bacterium]